ncbi:UDP-glucose dehydrogenase family protein [Desulfatitalea alkaliphila]|uniref:UDP-glucose 6-dehydrogenase n=1 Tax=Desulfatitalea alkaliphila TaxID=2929485 RepID=A0AA41UKB0_9BACT|nr:UDP-glucose/GDP-mannose dehydrogenase family protein [Desulfatitalea alkaliphila]MCJ8502124.1 UDP-glucose/GDP-mannose dehydrogenase family protein [Desulfatitalea alkaliphila]
MNVSIVGTGYVGLVAAACFAEMGNQVTCIDVNPTIVEQLNQGRIHIFEPGLEPLVERNRQEGRLTFTTDLAQGMADALFVFNCVGTPPNGDGSCDLRYVDQVAEAIGQTMEDYKIIVNKSTVPVGTADRVRGIIQEQLDKRQCRIEFDVVSNPEFLKEGDAVNDFLKPDRVIVGTDNVRTAKLLETLYGPFARSRDKMIVMGIRSAEMTKYAANSMLATKISFINEIANLCEKVGADIKDVRVGIGSDRRIGYHFIYPGVGYGGSCFPKDVKALIHTAREHGMTPELALSVDRVNQHQKQVLAEKIKTHFSPTPLTDKVLAIWGLAFKANTDDIRESAALDTIETLTALGMRIRAFDPVAGDNARTALAENPLVEIGQDQYSILQNADALAVLTDWNQFRNPDFARIKKQLNNPLIFDGRNLYSATMLSGFGFTYHAIGRPPIINPTQQTKEI